MQSRPLKIFFSGIAGSGLSAIADFMADRGHVVAGSDRAFDTNPDHPLKIIFQSRGIRIVPQDGSGIDTSFDFAVFSTAVEPDRPEIMKVKELGIQVKTRPEYLAEIAGSFSTIAVAGTSGKSTASGMLAFLMKRLGLDPNFIGGGRVKQFKTPFSSGNSMSGDSVHLIIEACESDGTIIHYRPQHSIILNLDLDHNTVEQTRRMFETVIQNTSARVFVNADDENLSDIGTKGAVTFSIRKPADYRAEDIVYSNFSSEFTVRNTRFRLSLPGEYNIYNALSCIAFLAETGTPLESISEVLPEFNGIDRRFDVHLNDGKHLVIDDYAHNPHKISALMKTVRRLVERVCYIFQPHGFGPVKMMRREYIEVFAHHLRSVDHLILLPIFYAGGTADRDISSNDLAEGIRDLGRSAEVVENRADISNRISEYECCAVFGARDDSLADLARTIAQCYESRQL
jgi:UDP-N-acetylmuramate--alanine ligase